MAHRQQAGEMGSPPFLSLGRQYLFFPRLACPGHYLYVILPICVLPAMLG